MDIKNAVVIVTGASSGIGEATARAASRAGARVVLLARRQDRIDALAQELVDALAVVCDVTRPEQVQHAIDTIISKFGRIDALINNAGQGLHATIQDIKLEDFKELLNLNSVAPLAMMQAVIPYMLKQGRGSIVNVSSGATLATYPGSAAYTSSKAALNMLSSVARLELAEAGIAVSVMHPSITTTEFYGSVKSGLTSAKAQEAETVSFAHPPEWVAETILGLIKSGAAQADLVPKEYGGSYEG
ncbi:SDR family oxidoreductase [Pseudomonas huanghezhanensis]|uniref:SDR family oxidoreductase n=1 Tax=Pseudomonas huanghezhanensis TaxID=3002903 RepID=UPI00228560A1|nr:SDR family oxidoreductase [Pseudomonas sp. BSw22131]